MTHATSNAPSMPASMHQACATHTRGHGLFDATGQDRTTHNRGIVREAAYVLGMCVSAGGAA